MKAFIALNKECEGGEVWIDAMSIVAVSDEEDATRVVFASGGGFYVTETTEQVFEKLGTALEHLD